MKRADTERAALLVTALADLDGIDKALDEPKDKASDLRGLVLWAADASRDGDDIGNGHNTVVDAATGHLILPHVRKVIETELEKTRGRAVTAAQLAMFDDVRPGKLTRPAEPIVRRALIDGRYRYTCERHWGSGPRLLVAGNNPSKANHRRDDPTIWRAVCFAHRLGFGSLVMVNVYPFVTASMDDLRRWRRGLGVRSGPTNAWRTNREWVAREIDHDDTYACLAAWGNLPDPEDLKVWLKGLGRVPWLCLGMTSGGAPKHLLARGRHRIPDDARLLPWRPTR